MTPGQILLRGVDEEMLKPGDPVIVYIDEKRRYLVKLREDGILGTDKGYIWHRDIIGHKYGESVSTSRGVKAYLLEPLHHDFIHGFKRATQIIYPKDASYMIYISGIKPGSIVLEAGVGTGALTSGIANVIGDAGKLYGFDINPRHIEIAENNIEIAGIGHRVSLMIGDVRENIPLREDSVDAVFYDLPDPWNALESAYRILKPSRMILIYVPTINQVEKTFISMLKTRCFIDVTALEILLREYNVSENATRPKTYMIAHTGYILYARKIIDPRCVLQ